MGTKERRERERQELRQSILAAAREVAAQEGWQAVTIRKVAELIEYSPPTIYEYFESKEAILQDLVHEGFRGLLAALQTAAKSGQDPTERMLKVAHAYADYAWNHPELYQVMFGMGGAVCNLEGYPNEIKELSTLLRSSLQAALDPVRLTPAEELDALDILLATLHGLVSMSMQDLMSGGRTRAAKLVDEATGAWLERLREQAGK